MSNEEFILGILVGAAACMIAFTLTSYYIGVLDRAMMQVITIIAGMTVATKVLIILHITKQ